MVYIHTLLKLVLVFNIIFIYANAFRRKTDCGYEIYLAFGLDNFVTKIKMILNMSFFILFFYLLFHFLLLYLTWP